MIKLVFKNPYISVYHKSMRKNNAKNDPISNRPFTKHVQNLFASIFRYHFKRRPIVSNRKTPFGIYASLAFRKAVKSPFLQLLKEELIGEFKSVEIIVKNGSNQKIDDTDLESIIISVRREPDTLFILATKGEVPLDDFDRLFRAFTRHLVIILPLGEKDIEKLENFVKNGNINACLVVLTMLANRITTDPWDEKMMQRHGGAYATRAEWQKSATATRLDKMDKLRGPQLRTLIKKIRFLMSFEESGDEISKACKAVKISRKTFYLWLEKDSVFRELVSI